MKTGLAILQGCQSINSRSFDRELILTGTVIGVIILNHTQCLFTGTLISNCGVIIALGTAHGAGTVDFAFCQTPRCAVSPGVQALLATKDVQYSALTSNSSLSLTAIITAASFHGNHSLTDLRACRGVRIDSLQAAHLPR